MKWRIWTGFLVTLAAVASYTTVFIWYPLTRDFPWVNLLLFVLAGYLFFTGLRRGRTVIGIILASLSFVLFALFAAGTFYAARSLPPGERALRVGQQAPDFVLTDVNDRPVSLAQLRQTKRAVLLIFYRGYW